MPIELIIFDNDGVLVDSETIANQILCDLLVENGVDITYEEVLRVFKGNSLAHCVKIARDDYGVVNAERFVEIYHQRIKAAYHALKSINGAHTLLESLHMPYCVASNSGRSKLIHALHITGLLHFFEGRTFSAEDVRQGKPAPDLFLYAAAQCHVLPASCLVIEDSPQGVMAAQAAGMLVIGYVPPGEPDKLSPFNIPIIEHLLDLLPMLSVQM